jgi:hypothetical protein
VRVEGAPVSALELPRAELEGRVMQVGRRRFVRFVQGTGASGTAA